MSGSSPSFARTAIVPPWHHLWAVLPLLLASSAVWGAESGVTAAVAAPLPGVGASIVRLLGALALVMAIVLVLFWFFRHGTRWTPKTAAQRRLKVLEVRLLGNRQSLFVVGYDRQRLLLGSSPTGMSFLARLPEGTEESMPAAVEGANGSVPTFLDNLRQALGNRM